jgi:hypothetical protein
MSMVSSSILLITSCTGEKSVEDENELTFEDFRCGATHVRERERKLEAKLTPAEDLYTGMQHARLMRGVRAARAAGLAVDLKIVSAGYGLVDGSRKLAPYEATFIGMGKTALRTWAEQLGIPNAVRAALAGRHDLTLVLLGDDYLGACALDPTLELGGATIVLCGQASASRLPGLADLKPVLLTSTDAKPFSCGLVGLKGEVAARILESLATDPNRLDEFVKRPQQMVAALAQNPATASRALVRAIALPHPTVDRVIEIPQVWWDKPHRRKLRYFIPEWDDLVDPDYDFANDTHSGGTGDWANEVYAHQLYPEPNYDGILMSRAVAEKSKKKDARINQMGVHRFLRLPRNFPIMGDCGAFDYIEQKEPPYTTDDVIDYYTRLDFDYGVSVDHLIVPAFYADKHFRYDLTIHNAESFLKEHRKRDLTWEPIGAVQGWDPASYASAAARYAKMGYRYIALGGLVRAQTQEILATVEQVRRAVPSDMAVHVFGFSRFAALREIAKLGVNSIDSASMLRKAWLGANLNYLTLDGWYSAIRVPQADGSFRAKRLKQSATITPEQLHRLEQDCLRELRDYASRRGAVPSSLVKHLHEYDVLVAGDRPGTEETIRRTLEARPWQACLCAICKSVGVEVVIFRGNNRNRRRGFHNTYVFYQLLQGVMNGERIPFLDGNQLELSMEAVAEV